MISETKPKKCRKLIYYVMLAVVILTWGIDPVVNKLQYENYSPLALSMLSTIFSAVMFFIMSVKKLKLLNARLLKIALPIGILSSLACVLQRVGLQLTTPSSYAFLEHLSCAFVPIALFLITKKRPSIIQVITVIICLIGCVLISGLINNFTSVNIGDVLCAIAGAMLGFSIALIASYAKDIDITLFTFIQMSCYFIISLLGAILLNHFKLNGEPFEEFRFSFNVWHLLFAVFFGLFSVGICWLLRNLAVANINPIFVAIVSPFSAIISSIISISIKIEPFTIELLIGGLLISVAVIISSLSDNKNFIDKFKKKNHG